MTDITERVRAAASKCTRCGGDGCHVASDGVGEECPECGGRGYVLTTAAVARALNVLDLSWRHGSHDWGEEPMDAALAALRGDTPLPGPITHDPYHDPCPPASPHDATIRIEDANEPAGGFPWQWRSDGSG